jgi:hypothetical protein
MPFIALSDDKTTIQESALCVLFSFEYNLWLRLLLFDRLNCIFQIFQQERLLDDFPVDFGAEGSEVFTEGVTGGENDFF